MLNELVLLESKSIRESYIEKVEVLNKVKSLSMLPDDIHVTTEMVADYYEVGVVTIKKIIQRNNSELLEDGLKVLKGKGFKEYYKLNLKSSKYSNKISSLTIIPRRAILRIGMLLRDSEVAKQVRNILKQENSELYCELSNKEINIKKYEDEMYRILSLIIPDSISIQKQVKCNKYHIDFVVDGNIAIEVDENGHTSYNKKDEVNRTNEILKNGYSLFRYDTRNNDIIQFVGNINMELMKRFKKIS